MAPEAVFARFVAKPGRRDELVAALAEVFPSIEREEGTLVFSMHVSDAEPDVVRFFELFADADARAARPQRNAEGGGVAARRAPRRTAGGGGMPASAREGPTHLTIRRPRRLRGGGGAWRLVSPRQHAWSTRQAQLTTTFSKHSW